MEQKPILNIMVDLETASTKENAAILSWAMVPFFTDGKEVEDAEPLDMSIDLSSCFLSGMDFDKGTQNWWTRQEPMAKHFILTGEKMTIQEAAGQAYGWMSILAEKYDLYLWARGLDFDIPKIEWCFSKFVERPLPYKYSHKMDVRTVLKFMGERPLPYKYSHKMDVRTVLKFMGVDQSQFEFKGTKHCSLDDCLHDVKMIVKAYQMKEERKNK